MKNRFYTHVFLKRLGIVIPACGRGEQALVNIFSNGDVATLSATDSELWIETEIEQIDETKEHYSFAIDSKKFRDIIKSFDDEIELNVTNKELTIKNNYVKGKYKVPIVDPKNLTIKVNNKKKIGLCQEVFKKILSKVLFAVSNDNINSAFTGIRFEIIDNKLSLAATDSKRLTFIELEKEYENFCPIVIPARTLREVFKHLRKGSVFISVLDNVITFEVKKVLISSRLIDKSFPDISSLVNIKYDTYFKTKRELLLKAVNRAYLFAKEPNYKVELKIDQGGCTIKASASEIGEAEEYIEGIHNGVDTVLLNGKYLLEAIDGCTEEEIFIGLSGMKNPVLITDEENYRSLLMPFKES